MNKLTLSLVFILTSITVLAQKPPIDHSVYDSWQSINGLDAPRNGDIVIYTIAPQQGDNQLMILNLKDNRTIAVPRSSREQATLSTDGKKAVAVIKPLFQQTRQAKIKKVKKEDMPKDTLAIIDITTGDIHKIPDYKSHRVPAKFNHYVAFQTSPKSEGKDDKKKDENGQPKQKKENMVFVLDINNMLTDTLYNIDEYGFNEDGSILAYTVKPEAKDSLTRPGLYLYDPATRQSTEILSGDKGSRFKIPVYAKTGLMAFYANTDTTKEGKKNIDIYLYDPAGKQLRKAASNNMAGLQEGWIVSPDGRLSFSEDGHRLFFGTAPRPLEKDTTLVEFEQPTLDIWSWDADYNPPMQLLRRDRDLKLTYTAYINTDLLSPFVQLGTLDVPTVSVPDKGRADYVLTGNNKKYRIQSQWNADAPNDIYLISVKDGSQKLLFENVVYYIGRPSPDGNYYVFYDRRDKNWFMYDLKNGKLTNLTKDLPVEFYDIEHDTPSLPGPYGNAVWFADGSAFIIPDHYDYWQFDPTGKTRPFLFTDGTGRATNTRFSYYGRAYHTDDPADAEYIQKTGPVYFSSLNKTNKEKGYYYKDLSRKKPVMEKLVEGPYTYTSLTLTKDKKPIYTYLRGNFSEPLNVWSTADNFKTQTQISDINPQQKTYNWGTVKLVDWITDDGIKAEGLLFTPENLDTTKKYPVILYFYEKNSDGLYDSRVPAPSRSTVNIPFFVSNGYVIFVPDIYYKDGHPGQSAMRSIMPGVKMLEEKYSWIDGDHMAIQGQSWGGYQVAYMITQTDKFAAAGAGAPVSNMTSAYGGIRWGSGAVRQFQYENTQSRIGKNLWEGFDLYVENSPLFFVPNVKTPVLIMHNDKDGAVPWYQGIEFFTALRRLGKTAWLLQYNDEDHNLVERRNSKDLSIRLEQFFNHYLKGAPMPEWMKYGRPAVKKGYDLGYTLTE